MSASGPTTGENLVDQALKLPEAPAQQRPPTDSSRLLLGLMELSRSVDPAQSRALDSVISPDMLRRLLATLHFRDLATVNHSRRVAQIAVGLAGQMRWEGRDRKLLEIAALLHDIGKIGVPDNILFKPGKLNPDEADLMALHACVSVDVLQACRVDPEVAQIISESRDFAYDVSKGRTRTGAAGHMAARILSVADAYDSLRSDQVYRRAKSHEDALRILVENAGTQFDGNVVAQLARWAMSNGVAQTDDYQTEFQPPTAGPAFSEPHEAQEADTLCRIFSYLYLLESLYDGFFLLDSDLRFVVWNGAAQRLLGHIPDRLLGRPWTTRTLGYADSSGQELGETESPMRQVIETGRAAATIGKLRQADGKWVDVELQTVPLLDDWGRLRGVAEIFRDLARAEAAPREFRELRLAASRDPLTGLGNRVELESQLTQMLGDSAANEWKVPSSVIFLDVDHFKEINDHFGHATGDIVLIELARLLQQETYAGEMVGRYGGEEFVILCPDTALDQAVQRAERIRLALAGLNLTDLDGWPLTASFGVTRAVAGDTADSVLRRADKALYAAKNSGRNQTCSLSASDIPPPQTIVAPSHATVTPQEDLVFEASFHACTAAEMIVYKLGGFMNEEEAKLLEIESDRVRMRLGHQGLFAGWGRTDDRRPVEVELDFGTVVPPRDVNGKMVKSNQVLVKVTIRPLGRPPGPEAFDARAKQVLKLLSTFFLAEV